MTRCAFAFASVLLGTLPGILHAQPRWFPEPLSARIANYSINATLDTATNSIRAKETLVWHNHSADSVYELRFHLYLNAFLNTQSTFFREGKSAAILTENNGWGWISVLEMRTEDGDNLTDSIQFIQPDDANPGDRTVVRVPLPVPLTPGGTVTLHITFRAQLPRLIDRTGYYRDFYMIGQWFPKIGVYESPRASRHSGSWNCHQFHANTEFFADFGVYDVRITVPQAFVVGATGTLAGEHLNQDGTKTVAFHAEDVHDFAWTASPRYTVHTEQWRHVTIRVLMQPQHDGQAWRYVQAAKTAMEYLDAHVGVYPYPVLTIVDPAFGAIEAGGMEYPTLITTGALWGIGPAIRFQELVTIHEFGHQYWYGMSASNEFEEPWLDEGVTQYYEARIADAEYGSAQSVLDVAGIRIGDGELNRAGYTGMRNPRIAPPSLAGWAFPSGTYGSLAYFKTAVVLATLERMIGTACMDSAMRTFFRRWRFNHPRGTDFVQAFNEVVPAVHGSRFGKTLDWYFNQTLFGTAVCDFELTSITSRPVSPARGILDTNLEQSAAVSPGQQEMEFESAVTVSNLGDCRLPVTVLVRFENGNDIWEMWNGQASTVTFRYHKPARAIMAVIDPENQIPLDLNRINNSKMLKPPRAPVLNSSMKVLFWIQTLIQFFAVTG